MITLTLPDGSTREYPEGVTILSVAESIGSRLARDTVAGEIDGEIVDLRTPLAEDASIRIITTRDSEAGDIIRHSAEHVMADAVKRIWPGTPIDAGRRDHSEKYQYDFRFPRPFKAEDFKDDDEPLIEVEIDPGGPTAQPCYEQAITNGT